MIDYRGFKLGKGTPHIVSKMAKAALKRQTERACRKDVDRRDSRRCAFPRCRKFAHEKHHILPRSRGGLWISSNIISLCSLHHQFLTAGLLRTTGNPDVKDSLRVHLTALGIASGVKLPKVA